MCRARDTGLAHRVEGWNSCRDVASWEGDRVEAKAPGPLTTEDIRGVGLPKAHTLASAGFPMSKYPMELSKATTGVPLMGVEVRERVPKGLPKASTKLAKLAPVFTMEVRSPVAAVITLTRQKLQPRSANTRFTPLASQVREDAPKPREVDTAGRPSAADAVTPGTPA